MIAVDTNILVYAHRTDIREHLPAREALERLTATANHWAIPLPCLHEFYAVVTGPAFGRNRTPPERAFDTLRVWATHPGCRLLSESESHLATLEALCLRGMLGGGSVHDAKIAAICLDHAVSELWTCDRDFNRFPDLPIRNPLIPSLREPLLPGYRVETEPARQRTRRQARRIPGA